MSALYAVLRFLWNNALALLAGLGSLFFLLTGVFRRKSSGPKPLDIEAALKEQKKAVRAEEKREKERLAEEHRAITERVREQLGAPPPSGKKAIEHLDKELERHRKESE